MRKSGILLHISSLPSRYGIGRLGQEAYHFVDFLVQSETACWQILPLSPTSYGDSPYQSFSVRAGNPYFIDFERLEAQGLLAHEDYASMLWQRDEESIDYELLYRSNIAVLRRAYLRFREKPPRGYASFLKANKDWLPDYALFMALKGVHGGKAWYEWEKPLAMREPSAIKKAKEQLRDEIGLHECLQFLFDRQWMDLKRYANHHGVEIIGDMPIYAAYDSADVWAHPEIFALDEKKRPREVAGCPPDFFSPTGQLWGNPLYDWEYHKKTGYAWWIDRLRANARLYDTVRIDHFRGFESYYAIPYGAKDAIKGKWRKGPGKALFLAAKKKLGDLSIIAEDLGFITPGVRKMLKALDYPGMKVLQFGFSGADNEHLPHNYASPNCVCYTGTHDNETLEGWLLSSDKKTIRFAKQYLRCKKSEIPDEMVALCWGSIARLAVAQMQDFLHEGKAARMNTPSTLGGNWMYRTHAEDFTPGLAKDIRKLNRVYGRAVTPEEEKADEPKETTKAEEKPLEKAEPLEKEEKPKAEEKPLEEPAAPATTDPPTETEES